MFDGSSIRGFQQIHESDMLLLPDPSTAVLDPFRQHKTLNMTFFVHDPLTGEPYSRDPRNIARKAEEYLRGTGHRGHGVLRPRGGVLHLRLGALLDRARTRATTTSTRSRARGTPARDEDGGNLGYKPRYKGGYFPVPPMDHFTDLRSEMVRKLIECGIDVEMQHHEVGTAGQAEIDFRFGTLLQDGRQPDALQVRRSRTSPGPPARP